MNETAVTPSTIARPKPADLFLASLAATGLVYGVGIAIIAVLVGLTSPEGGFRDAAVFLGFFATIGVIFAGLVGLFVVAPLGMATGEIMLRVAPPRWWQGPLTGLIVAAILVAITLGMIGLTGEPLDLGTYAVGAVPLLLAPFAGSLVSKHMLHWPNYREA